MKSIISRTTLVMATFALSANGAFGASPYDHHADGETLIRGHNMFLQDFRDYDRFAFGGDGLGPMFNGTSCVECHKQGAPGGAGGLIHNVDVMTISERSTAPSSQLADLHAGFVDADGVIIRSIILHKFSTEIEYSNLRTRIMGRRYVDSANNEKALAQQLKRSPVRTLRPSGQIYLAHSQRNTPALFGTGIIDRIPEQLIREQANKPKRFGVRGRVSEVVGSKVGRFGWRAQLPDLKEFVLSACANELGLDVEGHSQARNPLASKLRAHRQEISTEDSDALVKFVASLAEPIIDTSSDFDRVARGLRQFEDVGCTECHVRNLGPAKNLFSDLLLHDLGDKLWDPLGASPEIVTKRYPNPDGTGTRTFFEPPRVTGTTSASGYYFMAIVERPTTTVPNYEDPYTNIIQQFADTNVDPRREWRTPPLWGCADSAPYLHDGRAATLDEAIRLHGGEADEVTQRYTRLPKEKRHDILFFLSQLRVEKGT